jgi:Tol biopolymer transport system component
VRLLRAPGRRSGHDARQRVDRRPAGERARLRGRDRRERPVRRLPLRGSNLVAGDTNGLTDVFLHDFRTGRTERVSVGGAGQGDGTSFSASIDRSGRFVLFGSDATNLVGGDTNDVTDVFVRDRTAGTTRRISLTAAGGQANGGSLYGEISADGRVAAFVSDARNLVRADTNRSPDVFVRGLAP